jgi:hypothetical protein
MISTPCVLILGTGQLARAPLAEDMSNAGGQPSGLVHPGTVAAV